MSLFFRKTFLIYLLKFIGVYCLLYYGTQAWIGITTPGDYYSPFLQKYFDYISLLRKALMTASGFVVSLFGLKSDIINTYDLKLENGRGVHIVYSCLGIGVISFWMAFIIANRGNFKKKASWILSGLAAIFFINVVRVSLMLFAIAYNWKLFHKIDNHLFFNICAYACIFLMIWLYDRSSEKDSADI